MNKIFTRKAGARVESKNARRLQVAEDLISAYVTLHEDGKSHIERFLALSAYAEGSMAYYTPKQKPPTTEDEYPICVCVGPANEAWLTWARMVRKAKLTEFERIEAVREMLGALISQKNKSEISASELRAAAEKALEWTHWDAKRRAQDQVVRSSEYKALVQSLERRENVKEASAKMMDLLLRARSTAA